MDLTKTCKACKETKSISEFHPNKTCTLGVVGTCRKCMAERKRQWYSDNRAERQDDANERNRAKKQKAVDYFGGKCHDCNQSFPNCVFQFHHLNPAEKDANPSKLMNGREDKMWEELKKCIMLCANCHLMRHFIRKEAINATTH